MNKIRNLLLAFAIASSLSIVVVAQNAITLDKSLSTRNEEKPDLKWKFKFSGETSKAVHLSNLTPLIEKPAVTTEFRFVAEKGEYKKHLGEEKGKFKYEYGLSAGTITPTSRPLDSFATLGLGIIRNFESFDVRAKTKMYFSRDKSIGVADVEIGKTFKLASDVELRPFSRFSYFARLKSRSHHEEISNGVAWTNGATFDAPIGRRTHFETTFQFINDYGSVYTGKRFLANCDAKMYFQMGKLWTGPGISWVRVLNQSGETNLEKLHAFNYSWNWKF